MNQNSVNFDDKISDFYKNKNKKKFNINSIDIDKILVSKKYHMAKIILLKTLLDIMIMMLLDHYL